MTGSGGGGSLSVGAIAGIAVSVGLLSIIGSLIIILLCYYFCWLQRKPDHGIYEVHEVNCVNIYTYI